MSSADLAAFAARWGRPAISSLALGAGKDLFRSADGRVVVPVARHGRLALVLGEPLGPAAAIDAALGEFTQWLRRRRLAPVFLPLAEGSLPRYRALGLTALRIGSEARVHLASFALAGGAMKSARQAAARARREGCRAALLEPPHDARLLAELETVSDAWLATRRLAERTFGTGAFSRAAVRAVPVAVARDASGRVAAFLTLQRTPDGAGVDLLRRHPAAPPGAMDLLVVETALALRSAAASMLSLGFTPLAGLGGAGAPLAERALGLLRRTPWVYDFEGLRRFKEKFRPAWRAAYAAGPSTAAILAGLAFAAEVVPGRSQRT